MRGIKRLVSPLIRTKRARILVALLAAVAIVAGQSAFFVGRAASASAATTMWGNGRPSGVSLISDDRAVELGTKFDVTVDGTVSAARYYKVAGEIGRHTGAIWSSSGSELATVTFSHESWSGWQTAELSRPLKVHAGESYVVSYRVPKGGRYGATRRFSGDTRTPLLEVGRRSGVFTYSHTGSYPEDTWMSSQYWADVVFTPNPGASPAPSTSSSSTSTPRPTHSATPTPTITPTPTPSATPTPTPKPSSTPKPVPTRSSSPSPTPTPTQSSAVFPTRDSAGLPAGWAPTSTVNGNLVVSQPGQVVQDVRVTNGTIIIEAPNVTLRRIDAVGSIVMNGYNDVCYPNLLIEDSDFTPSGPTNDGGTPTIGYGSYTARNVMMDGVAEGFRVGGTDIGCGDVHIEDSFVRVKSPDSCTDWHGDGLQGYGGADVYVEDSTLIMQVVNNCYGTAPFFYPDQGNQTAHIDGLLVSGGGYPFRLNTPGTVQNLNVVAGSWVYAPADVTCSLVTQWSAQVVSLDANGQPVAGRPFDC